VEVLLTGLNCLWSKSARRVFVAACAEQNSTETLRRSLLIPIAARRVKHRYTGSPVAAIISRSGNITLQSELPV